MVREHVSFKDRRVLYYKLGQKMNNIRITRGIAKDKNKYKVQYIILIIYHEERTHAMHSSSRSQAEAIRYFRNRFTQCLEMQGEANIHKCFTSYLRNAFIILCNVFLCSLRRFPQNDETREYNGPCPRCYNSVPNPV